MVNPRNGTLHTYDVLCLWKRWTLYVSLIDLCVCAVFVETVD